MTDLEKISIIKDFVKMCYNELDIRTQPAINITNDKQWAKSHRSFGCYIPETGHITVYLGDRNLADFLRTLGHELIHHAQAERGEINTNSGETGSEIENAANAGAGILLRNYGKQHDAIYENKIHLDDIKKFNKPLELYENLWHTINEINLNANNAVELQGNLINGEFKVDNIIYTYNIKKIKNPYNDGGSFYNISFYPKDNITTIPQQGKENYIKILNTMYKVILDFANNKKPDYIGIASMDNNGSKNYHTVYANLTDNKFNRISGYFRKDVNLPFTTKNGKGRMVVLKKNQHDTIYENKKQNRVI